MDRMELFDEIEDFLKNRLSKEERAAFQIRIQENAELAAEVELHRAIIQANTDQEVLAFRDQMVSILAKETPTDKITTFQAIDKSQVPSKDTNTTLLFVRRSWRWLAAATVLIALGIWIFLPKTDKIDLPIVDNHKDTTALKQENIVKNSNPTPIDTEIIEAPKPTDQKRPVNKPDTAPTEIQSQYLALTEAEYQPYPGGVRSTEEQDTTALSTLEKAEIYYSESKLQEVIRLLKNPDKGERTEALKLRAHAYFQLRQFNNAAADFKELTTRSSFYKEDAEWNLLLCYLAQLPKSQSKFDPLLNQISADSNHPFAPKAKKLKAQIEQK